MAPKLNFKKAKARSAAARAPLGSGAHGLASSAPAAGAAPRKPGGGRGAGGAPKASPKGVGNAKVYSMHHCDPQGDGPCYAMTIKLSQGLLDTLLASASAAPDGTPPARIKFGASGDNVIKVGDEEFPFNSMSERDPRLCDCLVAEDLDPNQLQSGEGVDEAGGAEDGKEGSAEPISGVLRQLGSVHRKLTVPSKVAKSLNAPKIAPDLKVMVMDAMQPGASRKAPQAATFKPKAMGVMRPSTVERKAPSPKRPSSVPAPGSKPQGSVASAGGGSHASSVPAGSAGQDALIKCTVLSALRKSEKGVSQVGLEKACGRPWREIERIVRQVAQLHPPGRYVLLPEVAGSGASSSTAAASKGKGSSSPGPGTSGLGSGAAKADAASASSVQPPIQPWHAGLFLDQPRKSPVGSSGLGEGSWGARNGGTRRQVPATKEGGQGGAPASPAAPKAAEQDSGPETRPSSEAVRPHGGAGRAGGAPAPKSVAAKLRAVGLESPDSAADSDSKGSEGQRAAGEGRAGAWLGGNVETIDMGLDEGDGEGAGSEGPGSGSKSQGPSKSGSQSRGLGREDAEEEEEGLVKEIEFAFEEDVDGGQQGGGEEGASTPDVSADRVDSGRNDVVEEEIELDLDVDEGVPPPLQDAGKHEPQGPAVEGAATVVPAPNGSALPRQPSSDAGSGSDSESGSASDSESESESEGESGESEEEDEVDIDIDIDEGEKDAVAGAKGLFSPRGRASGRMRAPQPAGEPVQDALSPGARAKEQPEQAGGGKGVFSPTGRRSMKLRKSTSRSHSRRIQPEAPAPASVTMSPQALPEAAIPPPHALPAASLPVPGVPRSGPGDAGNKEATDAKKVGLGFDVNVPADGDREASGPEGGLGDRPAGGAAVQRTGPAFTLDLNKVDGEGEEEDAKPSPPACGAAGLVAGGLDLNKSPMMDKSRAGTGTPVKASTGPEGPDAADAGTEGREGEAGATSSGGGGWDLNQSPMHALASQHTPGAAPIQDVRRERRDASNLDTGGGPGVPGAAPKSPAPEGLPLDLKSRKKDNDVEQGAKRQGEALQAKKPAKEGAIGGGGGSVKAKMALDDPLRLVSPKKKRSRMVLEKGDGRAKRRATAEDARPQDSDILGTAPGSDALEQPGRVPAEVDAPVVELKAEPQPHEARRAGREGLALPGKAGQMKRRASESELQAAAPRPWSGEGDSDGGKRRRTGGEGSSQRIPGSGAARGPSGGAGGSNGDAGEGALAAKGPGSESKAVPKVAGDVDLKIRMAEAKAPEQKADVVAKDTVPHTKLRPGKAEAGGDATEAAAGLPGPKQVKVEAGGGATEAAGAAPRPKPGKPGQAVGDPAASAKQWWLRFPSGAGEFKTITSIEQCREYYRAYNEKYSLYRLYHDNLVHYRKEALLLIGMLEAAEGKEAEEKARKKLMGMFIRRKDKAIRFQEKFCQFHHELMVLRKLLLAYAESHQGKYAVTTKHDA